MKLKLTIILLASIVPSIFAWKALANGEFATGIVLSAIGYLPICFLPKKENE